MRSNIDSIIEELEEIDFDSVPEVLPVEEAYLQIEYLVSQIRPARLRDRVQELLDPFKDDEALLKHLRKMLKRSDECSALEQISNLKSFLRYYSEASYIFYVSDYVYTIDQDDLVDLRNRIINLLDESR